MRAIFASLLHLFLVFALPLQLASSQAAQAGALTLVEPADGAVTILTSPHLQWSDPATPTPQAMGAYDVQIAADEAFSRIVDEDHIAAVIRHYVPDQELKPGEYWWRVAGVHAQGVRGPWSPARRFIVRSPEHVFEIRKDATFATIKKVLAEAAANTPALVKFEAGDYRLDPAKDEAFLDLSHADDLILDGGGGNFTFTGYLKYVRLEHCRRVLVRHFNFDFDPLPYTAGRVLAVDAKAGTFEIEIAPGHPLPDSSPHFSRDKRGMIVDPQYPRMKRGVKLVFEHTGWTRLEGRRYRFKAANPRQLGDVAPGDIYVLDPRIATGFDVNGGDEVVFQNLVAYAVSNEAFNSHYANRLSLLHCGIRLKPGRFIAANNGGHNHHNDRLGPWIEGCTWENTGDDICHVNCLVLGVEAKLAPDRVRLPLRNPFDLVGSAIALDIQPGDLLQFYNQAKGRLISERRVVSVQKQGQSLVVQLDGAVGDIVTGRPGISRVGNMKVPTAGAVTQVFDATRSCNQFVFRNNTVRNGRRVGLLAKGQGGLIENNTFEGLGGGAVEFWNAPFEGLGAVDYVVRDNTIRDCGLLAREHAAIWATIFKTGGDRLHRNILLDHNTIIGFPAPAILLRDVENAVIRDNSIFPGKAMSGNATGLGEIVKINASDVTLDHNVIRRE